MYYLPEGFRIEPHKSGKPHCKEVIFPDGRRLFLKYPHQNDNLGIQVVELYNELLFDTFLQVAGFDVLRTFPKTIELKLGLLMTYFEFDWSTIINNPNFEVVNRDRMPLCFVIDVFVGQADRGLQTYHHIGVKQVGENRFIFCPIDNGHSLGGYQRDKTFQTEIPTEFINGLFWAHQPMDLSNMEKEIQKIKEMDVISLGDEVARVLVVEGGLSMDTQKSLMEYNKEITNVLIQRQEKLLGVLSNWITGKLSQVEIPADQTLTEAPGLN